MMDTTKTVVQVIPIKADLDVKKVRAYILILVRFDQNKIFNKWMANGENAISTSHIFIQFAFPQFVFKFTTTVTFKS